MADYSIYILDESDITIDGAVLDGVTQGSGSHMVGATIVLENDNWNEVLVTDNDSDFGDTDGSQVLNGDQVIDGVTYAGGTALEAEYALTVTDGTNTYTVVAFNVNNSNPAYGTIEGLAFIGPEGGFPPVGVELTVISNEEGPNYAAADYATPICFGPGTLIGTAIGPRPVEMLSPGDLVVTEGNGLQPVRWIHRREHAAWGASTPVLVRAGAIGNSRDLLLSGQHKVRFAGWRAEFLFGQPAVLVAAKDLVNGSSVVFRPGGGVTYWHFALDRHELIRAEGAVAETLLSGDEALASLAADDRAGLLGALPGLERGQGPASALPTLRAYEARMLLAA